MPEAITVSQYFEVSPQRLYQAWLSPEEHGHMIGAGATAEADGRFTAWDGYISGRTLETVPNARVVQAWRTTDFTDDAPDSRLEVRFEPDGHGTKLILEHSNIPDGLGAQYEEGWDEHYFQPMARFFAPPGQTLEDVGARVNEALDKATDAVEHAIAATQKKATAALKAVKTAKATASAKVQRAAKAVARVGKTAKKDAKRVTKKVRAALAKKKPAKKTAAKKAPAKSTGAARKSSKPKATKAKSRARR